MPSNRSETAASVPNVAHTGMPWRAANAGTPPTWSECSWVTRIAVIDDGASPSRPRRVAAPRTPNPQSISTRVPPDSTTSPLPSLPLPRDAKRMRAAPLLELIAQERGDLLAGRALVGGAVRVLHGHETAWGCIRHG